MQKIYVVRYFDIDVYSEESMSLVAAKTREEAQAYIDKLVSYNEIERKIDEQADILFDNLLLESPKVENSYAQIARCELLLNDLSLKSQNEDELMLKLSALESESKVYEDIYFEWLARVWRPAYSQLILELGRHEEFYQKFYGEDATDLKEFSYRIVEVPLLEDPEVFVCGII